MSDYGSGDELLDGIDPDELISPKTKRPNVSSDDVIQQPSKRVKQSSTQDDYDSIARSILQANFGYKDFRHEQVRD